MQITSYAQTNQSENMNKEKILVAFFSRAGENYAVGHIEKGNTHIMADMIAAETGGDLFQIEPVTPYPEDYMKCTEVAKQELEAKARPAHSGRCSRRGLQCHFHRLSQLVGRNADGCLYVYRETRLAGQDRHSLLHP